jgi:hypothetical protein
MKSPFYLIAVILGIIALFIGGEAFSYAMQAERHKSHSIEAATKQNIRYAGDMEATRLEHIGNCLSVAGLALTLCGVCSMIAAKVQHEKGWYVTLMGLFVADVIALMLD